MAWAACSPRWLVLRLCFVTDLTLQQLPPRMGEMNQGQGLLLVRPITNPHTWHIVFFWTQRAWHGQFRIARENDAWPEMKGGRE